VSVAEPAREELEAAHCWEADDRVPGRPAMTAFRRRARLHQARWREAHGHPMGTQPMRPVAGKPVRDVGSRLPVDHALETGATFVTTAARDAADARFAMKEPHQSIDATRTYADLLWPSALAFNLFADAHHDRLGALLWPERSAPVDGVRYLHSPGWLDPDFTGNLLSFDVAFEVDDGIVGVLTKYADRIKAEIPKPTRLARYRRVHETSDAFVPSAFATLTATTRIDLWELWLTHLLVHSMLQHPSGAWTWGRLVVVHPEQNLDYVDACERYRSLLSDEGRATFASITIEALLDAGVLPKAAIAALRARYGTLT
jgi:hypothetical protein